MVVAQVSPKSVLANPSYVNPLAQASSHTAPTQAAQAAQQAIYQSKTDTVTISPQAAQMSAKANGAGEEKRENSVQQYAERAKGRS